MSATLMPTIASPRPRDASAITAGSSKNVVAFTIAAARAAGFPALKMPEPTNTPSAPSCIISAASAGVATPPAVNSTTGSLPVAATSATSSYGACSSLAATYSSSLVLDLQRVDLAGDRADVLGRLRDVAGAGLALRADHRGALGDATQRLAEVRGTADERHGERPLVDVVHVVGGRQHLGLVDVVDPERLQHLRLDEVADAGLRHDRDGDGRDDAVDEVGVAHARHAALSADVGRDALERHDGDRAGVLGDPRLLGGDDVHDDAALEHLGESALDAARAQLVVVRGVSVVLIIPRFYVRQRMPRVCRGQSASDVALAVSAGQAVRDLVAHLAEQPRDRLGAAMIGKKFASVAQRGTTCWCRCAGDAGARDRALVHADVEAVARDVAVSTRIASGSGADLGDLLGRRLVVRRDMAVRARRAGDRCCTGRG